MSLPYSSSLGTGELAEDFEDAGTTEDDRWSQMLPELLAEIVRRVDRGSEKWPARKSVVACAGVCKRWREVTLAMVRPPVESGKITLPLSLKQPGLGDLPLQCFIKRNKKNATFYLYLSLNQALTHKGKFLLAARRVRHGSHEEYIISLAADELSQASTAYVGKLSSDFWGNKFKIYDTRPPYEGAKATTSRRLSHRFTSKQISPQVPVGNFEIGQVSYKFNLLRSRGPRRMVCTIHPPRGNTQETVSKKPESQNQSVDTEFVVLKNKAPRWHEQLQCWCLNFHGRVTIASVKNFQLAAATNPNHPASARDEETVLLQFGKVGNDLFTMDYRKPLSAFQAFAICLTSFGTKLACE